MKKILIANRGEIACRIIRTAKKMGIRTTAVFSEIDRDAPHTLAADEAFCIGPATSTQSYLNIEKIIAVALSAEVDGIHPGYGFLSENASFAREVRANDITFIGPSPEAIEIMGSKLAAKAAVKTYDIPMVPGVDQAIDDIRQAETLASEIGFPVLIKASAGGGGKGMRIVQKPSQFKEQMERAVGEAKSAFGDGSVFIEKYIAAPKHIEIQVLADRHGNIVHLFERDCSIQRRHQKVVEEAPGPTISPALRQAMGTAAVQVARSCNYQGAGTVEFLLDEEGHFYFLEMNTRLQVEHPVTEMITGLDLVEEQIKIARGDKLSFQQEDLSIDGHAIELRVYAEDPLEDFIPSTGSLITYQAPHGPGVRVDEGVRSGMQVSIYYDPMLSKLICHGKTRSEAMQKMIRAIDAYEIEGIKTTLPFGKFVMSHPSFQSGNFSTHFVSNHYSSASEKKRHQEEMVLAAKVALHFYLEENKKLKMPIINNSNWRKNRLL